MTSRRETSAARWFVALSSFTAPVTATGCAIDGHGVVRVRRLGSERGEIVQLETIGIHVSTVPGDRGITLGHTRRTYGYAERARPGDDPTAALTAERTALHASDPAAAAEPRDRARAEPVWISTSDTGLVLGWSAGRRGLRLGHARRDAVVLPIDFNGLLCVRASACAGLPDAFFCEEFE